jgi:hypothetical protein
MHTFRGVWCVNRHERLKMTHEEEKSMSDLEPEAEGT